MQTRDGDNSDYLRPPGICRRLFSLVMAKLMASRLRPRTLGRSQEGVPVSTEAKQDDGSAKKESGSDIIIHFKQKDDSEEKLAPSIHESERETPIKLVNGNGPKKTVSINGVRSEQSSRPPVALPERGKSKAHRHHRPLLSVVSNINEKSDAFIRSRKEKMRKSLEPKT